MLWITMDNPRPRIQLTDLKLRLTTGYVRLFSKSHLSKSNRILISSPQYVRTSKGGDGQSHRFVCLVIVPSFFLSLHRLVLSSPPSLFAIQTYLKLVKMLHLCVLHKLREDICYYCCPKGVTPINGVSVLGGDFSGLRRPERKARNEINSRLTAVCIIRRRMGHQ